MERETRKIKMELGNDLEMRVDKLESLVAFDAPEIQKRLICHQQETEKLKKIKTEEAINYGENQSVTSLTKKISELKNQVLEKDRAVDEYRDRMQGLEKEIENLKLHIWMNNQIIKEMKRTLSDSLLSKELLRQKNVEANRTVEELSSKISACEEEKKMSDWIQEDMKQRESENIRCVEDLRRQNLEASRSVEELRRRVSACEEEKKMADRVLGEMKLRESENIRCVGDLRRRNSEASRSVEELRRRISVCEEEKKCKESENLEANKKVEELRDRVSAFEEEKKTADRVREEMKVRESDLRRQVSRAEQCVEEMKERGLEARKVAEVNMKRFGNVVPIAEELCKLLRMNMDDLVRMKDKFVWDDEGLISSSAVTTTNGETGGPRANEPVELTISATAQSTKKRFFSETKTSTTPSSAPPTTDIIDIIDDDDEEFVRSWSYEVSPVIPKRKRSKCVVGANKSLIKRKGMFGADMVRAFEEDDELCMHAVCALYRQHVSTSESAECSNRLFYHFEALRGRALADYLIGGDPELRLTRSVDEVKQRYPDVVNQCRRLAIHYSSYFTAMPRTHEPLYRSLTLVCCHCLEILKRQHAFGKGTIAEKEIAILNCKFACAVWVGDGLSRAKWLT